MSKQTKIYIYPNDDGSRWYLKKEGNLRASYGFDHRKDAEKLGKKLVAQNLGKLEVKNKDEKVLRKINILKDRTGQRSFHVEKRGSHWIVKASDRKMAKHKFTQKAQAIKMARAEAARHSSVMIVHDVDGHVTKIQDLRGIPAPR